MLNKFKETFAVTEMRTFKHEPFLLLGAEEGEGRICGTLRYIQALDRSISAIILMFIVSYLFIF